jgi:CheY-like chemotaxis protein
MVPLALGVPEEHCVLVVEDNITVRFLVATHLRDAGLQVAEARCAADALSYLQAGGRMDLLLTDVEMPGAMNGLTLAGRIRAEFPDLPIIVTSGNITHAADVKTGVFLAKPYNMRQFVKRVLELLNLGGAA